jgi:tetratricopeptide (TPR) repeat protein
MSVSMSTTSPSRFAQSAWSILAVAALATGGCTAGREAGQASWLKLPSPWATVQASEKRPSSPTAPKVAAERGTARKSADAQRPADQEPVAMAILRGRNFERSGDYEKARQLYEELAKKHPDSPQLAHRLGVVADCQRRHAEAEHYFQAALSAEPRNAEVLADLGYCYFLQGQLSKAESALLKATLVEPANKRYRNNLGLVLGHLGRHDEALAHFKLANSEADACYNLAFIFAAQERVEEAKKCFQMALNADPTHDAAREALASFEEFDQLPDHMRNLDTLADGDVRWVPYVEGGSNESQVVQAGASTVTSRDASRVTRALHQESRGMLNRNMQSQRNDEPPIDSGQ